MAGPPPQRQGQHHGRAQRHHAAQQRPHQGQRGEQGLAQPAHAKTGQKGQQQSHFQWFKMTMHGRTPTRNRRRTPPPVAVCDC
ncbi:hypothetical protein WNB94_16690 [Aquabacterium sp. A3]|uniref:hypothetical protein n=1 Tax=Aquabacterium sp. A3 TaxID=3132829 RepID=UPI00311952A2